MLDRQMDRINNVKLVMKIMDNKKNVHFRFTKDTQGLDVLICFFINNSAVQRIYKLDVFSMKHARF